MCILYASIPLFICLGTYSSSVSNFQANQTSSSSVRLSWDELTRPRSVTTVGYLVSYGRVDHGVRENMIIEGGSTTNVDLSNLHTGVEYEATIRGFSEDGTVRRVSTPVATTKWTIEGELRSYFFFIFKLHVIILWFQHNLQ